MEKSLESKSEIKDKLLKFYNFNKVKIYSLALIVLISITSILFLKYNNIKKNILISEKYIQAGLYLSQNKNENAKKLYEEIILSKNKFYSILALNTIVEKKLVADKNKIIEYFGILEKSLSKRENNDLIELKKALYLIKVSDIENGKNLLKNLIDKNSSLKSIAEELLQK